MLILRNPARVFAVSSVAIALLILSTATYAQADQSALETTRSKRASELTHAFKPSTVLRQVVASLIGTIGPQSIAQAFTTSRSQPLSVDFTSRGESERVSLMLGESQLRVRLRQDLQLHCEVSSSKESDREPEFGIDLALQFKF